MNESINTKELKEMILFHLNKLSKIVKAITFLVSVLYILGSVYRIGFYDITPNEQMWLNTLQTITLFVFFFSIAITFIIDYTNNRGGVKTVSIIFSILYFLLILPHIFSRPDHYHYILEAVWNVVHSELYISTLLVTYAIITISKGVIDFISSKINPALMFMVSFIIIIIIGAGLLLLPKSTIITEHLSWVDALFVSTSAVCVTGLTPIDISSVFTLQGQFIIMILIQVGGLGVMTFTSFFAMFFIGKTALSNQLIIRDMISSDAFGSLLSVLVNIFVFTIVIELFGAGLLWYEIHGTNIAGATIFDELFFSVFHSISAFCNAGFSTLEGNLGNPMLMAGHNMFYVVISVLVILGGIGFPILVNFKALLAYEFNNLFRRIFHPERARCVRTHITSINTKLVISWTIGLLIAGTVAFMALEWNRSFAGMSVYDKITHAFFNSACTRTAGFNSVDLTGFALQSILIYIVLMWIGGASQSTAGGIKVNVLAVALLNLIAIIRGKGRSDSFGREVDPDSIKKANATIIASLIILFIFIFTISFFEPTIPFLSLVFECVSAMGTVGSSLNTTPLLGDSSKLLISALMFIGRIGVITFLMSLVPQKKIIKYRYPKEHVIIN
jgi:Trk-type K+ transport systems, membrane components